MLFTNGELLALTVSAASLTSVLAMARQVLRLRHQVAAVQDALQQVTTLLAKSGARRS